MTDWSRWVFYIVDLGTTQVMMDIPLTRFSGEVSLSGGVMSASFSMIDMGYDQRRQLIDYTQPGRYSIAAVRDGVCRGEWIIWKRTRQNDLKEIGLDGAEVVSYLKRRLMQDWTWSQREQLDIARDLATYGFAGHLPGHEGGINMSVAYASSGQKRDREYRYLDGDVLTRLHELSDVVNGFDFYVTTQLDTGTTAQVTRSLGWYYPRAGSDQPLVFEMAASGSVAGSGNILGFTLEEDSTEIASTAYTIGAQSADADKPITSKYEDLTLVNQWGLRYFERVQSYSSVVEQATIDSYAQSLWEDSQRQAVPTSFQVLADSFPRIGDYSLGDRVTLSIEESINFPDGYHDTVRITGWTFELASSGPDVVSLTIAEET